MSEGHCEGSTPTVTLLEPVVKIPPTGTTLEKVERRAVVEALKMSGWVRKSAAELLGTNVRALNYRISKYYICRTLCE